MEVRSLAVVLKVAEAGSISQAALALGMTQPALSRVVAAIEREVGAPLFHRTGRGVALTEVGESLLPAARHIVHSMEQLVAEVRDRAREPRGLVTLALMPTLTGVIAEPLFASMRLSHPGIMLRMVEGFSANIAQWLAEGRADVGLLSRFGPTLPAGDELLHSSHMMLVGRAGRGAVPATVRFTELARLPLVLPAPPNGTRTALDRIAHKLGVRLDVVVETDSLEAQKAIVARHGCHTVLDPRTVEPEVARGVFQARTLVSPKVLRRVVVATTTHRPLGRAAREVVARIRALYR